jgi:hypothetical protein
VYGVAIWHKADLIKFKDKIGFVSARKQAGLSGLTLKYAKPFEEWEEITDIQEAGNQTVYDLYVPEKHCFWANGMLSHNSGKSTAMISLMLKWCAINKTKFFLKLVFDDINRMFDAILSKPDYPIGTPFATDEGDEQFGGLNTAIESMDTKNTEKRCRALGYPIFYACPNIMVHQSHFIFETDGLIRDQNLWVRAAKVLVHDADGLLRGSLLLPAPRKDVLEAYFALPKALMMDKDHLRNIAKSQYLKADEYVDALVAGKITCEGHAFEEMKNFEQRLWFIIKTSKYRTKAMAKYIISGYDMKRPPEEEKPEKKSKKKEDEKEAKEETPKRGRGRPTKKEEEEQDEEPVSVPESKDNTQTKLEDTPQSEVEEDADELN